LPHVVRDINDCAGCQVDQGDEEEAADTEGSVCAVVNSSEMKDYRKCI
jgi:hypothetical protein